MRVMWEHILARQELRLGTTQKWQRAPVSAGADECQADMRPNIGSNGGHPHGHHEDGNEQFRKIRLITATLEKSFWWGPPFLLQRYPPLMTMPSDWFRCHATPATHSLDAIADRAVMPCCAGRWSAGPLG